MVIVPEWCTGRSGPGGAVGGFAQFIRVLAAPPVRIRHRK